MHCRLHYKSPRLERHERKMCFLLLSAALVGNLKRSPGISTSLGLSNFIWHKKMQCLNQTKIRIRFDACKIKWKVQTGPKRQATAGTDTSSQLVPIRLDTPLFFLTDYLAPQDAIRILLGNEYY